jgi:LmbE family N-acetylglucosaminyl deacetylase
MFIDGGPNHVTLVVAVFIMPNRASHPIANAGQAAALLAATLIVLPGVLSAHIRHRAVRPPRPTLSVDMNTRLLIVSPHPDDEVLAAGGLMQHLRAAHGTLRVVYLTDGEGYREGVQLEEHVASPTASNYRAYGRQRTREAHRALRVLGFGRESLTFLGFPNGGLNRMMTTYWSERRNPYRSPYSRLDRPTKSEIVVPRTQFRGEDLSQELATIIGDFAPTMVLVPRKEDQHGDHCAAWFFLADALGDVRRLHPDRDIDLVSYIVHYYSWPFEDDRPRIEPPEGLRGGVSGWLNVPLTATETRIKRAALAQYKSQMDVMGWFLEGFARRNELFSRPAAPLVAMPVRRSPCDDD